MLSLLALEENIRVPVEGWFAKTNQIQYEETELQNALKDINGWLECCCFKQYKIGKVVKRMHDQVILLLNESRTFGAMSKPPPCPPCLDLMQTSDFQVYDSTRIYIDQILDALKHDDIHIVGVFGSGGVGKTALMKQVVKFVKNYKFFDQVLMGTVSQDPVWRNIQTEISENLGLLLSQEFPSVRATILSERFLKEKRILIVFDDLWKHLNLMEQVGISCGNNCKVVITTRQLQVCSQMETQVNVEIQFLTDANAWALFKSAAGDHLEVDNALHPVAKQIVGECGGLPLAILTIGRARVEDQSVWEDAAIQLKKSSSSPPDIEGVHEKVFCSIKMSYDFLAIRETKFCLLLCCMFPDDFNISEDDLLPYMVGEGLFGDVDNLVEERYTQLERLKRSCSLLECNDSKKGCCVRMHFVIRDVSIWIASIEGLDFIIKSGIGM